MVILLTQEPAEAWPYFWRSTALSQVEMELLLQAVIWEWNGYLLWSKTVVYNILKLVCFKVSQGSVPKDQ